MRAREKRCSWNAARTAMVKTVRAGQSATRRPAHCGDPTPGMTEQERRECTRWPELSATRCRISIPAAFRTKTRKTSPPLLIPNPVPSIRSNRRITASRSCRRTACTTPNVNSEIQQLRGLYALDFKTRHDRAEMERWRDVIRNMKRADLFHPREVLVGAVHHLL